MNEYAHRTFSEAMRLTEIFIAFIDAWSEQIFDRLRADTLTITTQASLLTSARQLLRFLIILCTKNQKPNEAMQPTHIYESARAKINAASI